MATGRELAGQVALVTGGGRGIGRAIAETLAAAGAAVGVASRSSDELADTVTSIERAGGVAHAVPTDVTNPRSVDDSVAALAAALGPVDLLVNNAGSNRAVGPTWDLDPDAWWSDFEVNVRGAFLCARAVLPSMVERGRGRIVTIASGTAGRAFPYNAGYATSKAALVRITDCLAAETAEHGVYVFAVGPGNVETKLTKDLRADAAAQRWMGDVLDGLSFTSPSVVADTVVFLATGHGDRLTGRWFAAADDVRQLVARADEIAAHDLYRLRHQTTVR